MFRFTIAGAVLLTVAIEAAVLRARPTTQPSDAAASTEGRSKTEIRAAEEMGRGNYAAALILYRKVAEELKDQPERLGPIQEAIRVCEKNVLKAAAAQQDGVGNAPPPTAEARKPHAPPVAGKVVELEIKDLGNFDYDADVGGNIPDDVKRLDGSTLRLKGFMIPMDQAENITEFALVPSLFACCFGQPPQVQHTILVHAPSGKAVSYYPDEIVVEGRLTVDEKKEDGFIVSIFEVECSSVKPSEK